MAQTHPVQQPSNPILGRLQDVYHVVFLLLLSLSYLPVTFLQNPLLPFTDLPAFRHKWFGRLWVSLGPQMALSPEQVDYIESLSRHARGTVLELGPGGGDQMYHFRSVRDGIDHIYGAEPNAMLHKSLLQRAKEQGLGDRYTCLTAGAEPQSLLPALKMAGLIPADTVGMPQKGVFDTIICVKSMCSAPQEDMAPICANIQALLKPGGEFVFFEHVENYQDPLSKAIASIINLIWPLVMGGCHLNGRVDRVVQSMSGWHSCKVAATDQFKGYNIFRYVTGVCRK